MKMFIKTCYFASLMVVLLTQPTLANNAELGKELYAGYCENCHGMNKSGLQGYNGDLSSFTERLAGVTDSMPDFSGFFEENEIEALHAYLTQTDESPE